MKKTISGLLMAGALVSTPVLARNLSVEVTNLTNGTYFTPLLISAHSAHVDVFEPGTPATAHLQAMAEGGDISGLISDLEASGADIVSNPAGGRLAPGASTHADLTVTRGNRRLSIVAMLLPTNDGFVGLDALKIPRRAGTYTYYLNGYDAGTEANNELINGGGAPGVLGIPADPGGANGINGTGYTTSEANTTVHIHPGVLGDNDPNGGPSDLDSTVHRWLNPVAKLVITVSRDDDG